MRDESHRFAITFHRELRTKAQSVSILEFATSPGEETAERAKAGQLSGTGQPAEHAETRILPSHRESVRRYFNNSPDQP